MIYLISILIRNTEYIYKRQNGWLAGWLQRYWEMGGVECMEMGVDNVWGDGWWC